MTGAARRRAAGQIQCRCLRDSDEHLLPEVDRHEHGDDLGGSPHHEPLEHRAWQDDLEGQLGLLRQARRPRELGRNHRNLLRCGRLSAGRGEQERGLAVVRRQRTGTRCSRPSALHRETGPATVGGAMSDEPAARAVALVERLFALLHDCRALVPQLEAARTDPEPVSAQAERLALLRAGRRARGWPGPHRGGCADRAAPGKPAARADGGGVAGAAGAGAVTRAVRGHGRTRFRSKRRSTHAQADCGHRVRHRRASGLPSWGTSARLSPSFASSMEAQNRLYLQITADTTTSLGRRPERCGRS